MNDKLIKIQNELNFPKAQFNSFGNYNYRSCEDILEALKPLLKKEGLLMTITDEIVEVGGRNYVKAIIKLSLKIWEALEWGKFAMTILRSSHI